MIEVYVREDGIAGMRGEATIHYADELREQLLKLLESNPRLLVIDLSEMNDLDVAGLQVLLAFRKSAPSVALQHCPESCGTLAENLGLKPYLFNMG